MNNQVTTSPHLLSKSECVTKSVYFFHCVQRHKINKNAQMQNQQFSNCTIKDILEIYNYLNNITN